VLQKFDDFAANPFNYTHELEYALIFLDDHQVFDTDALISAGSKTLAGRNSKLIERFLPEVLHSRHHACSPS